MNKTIIINISGVIFHIEEDAYENLKQYIVTVKNYFISYQDHQEIITDIENRIAEMFSEILHNEGKQVIVIADVDTVIQKMGKPSEFDDASENSETYIPLGPVKRKLFRDTDDKILGGVCAGIAHYFDIKSLWVRVGFSMLFIFFGFGLIPYILLWLIVPRAISRSDKMQMKGEKINLQAFQKNMEQEINSIKSEFEKRSGKSLNEAIKQFMNGLFSIIKTLTKTFLKFVGVMVLIFVGMGLIAAFVCLILFLGYAGNSDVSTIFPLNALDPNLRPAVYFSVFFVIFIPLLGLLFLILRYIFKNDTIGKSLGFSMMMIWIVALAVGIFTLAKNATNFKEEASFSETIELKNNLQNTYFIKIANERTLEENYLGDDEQNDKVVTITGSDRDFDTPNIVDLELNLVNNGGLSIIKTYKARGRNVKDALNNAQQVEYYYAQRDSLLAFDYNLGLNYGSLWRAQEVSIKLNVPVGSILYIQKRFISQFLGNQMYDCLNEDAEDETYIEVVAKQDGFTCKRSESSIEQQKQYNLENKINAEIKDSVVFN